MLSRVDHATIQCVIKMLTNGTQKREIGRTVGASHATLTGILQDFQDEGDIHDAARSLSRKATNEDDRPIVAVASIDLSMTAGQITDVPVQNASEELVRQRLRKVSPSHKSAAKKHLLSYVAKRRRLHFAYAHSQWTADDWQNVVFTD